MRSRALSRPLTSSPHDYEELHEVWSHRPPCYLTHVRSCSSRTRGASAPGLFPFLFLSDCLVFCLAPCLYGQRQRLSIGNVVCAMLPRPRARPLPFTSDSPFPRHVRESGKDLGRAARSPSVSYTLIPFCRAFRRKWIYFRSPRPDQPRLVRSDGVRPWDPANPANSLSTTTRRRNAVGVWQLRFSAF